MLKTVPTFTIEVPFIMGEAFWCKRLDSPLHLKFRARVPLSLSAGGGSF